MTTKKTAKKVSTNPIHAVNPERFTTQALCDQAKKYLKSLGYTGLDQWEDGDTGSTVLSHDWVPGIEDEDHNWELNVAGRDWDDVGDFGSPGIVMVFQDDNVLKGTLDPFSEDLRITNLEQIPVILKKYGFGPKA